MKIHFVSFDPSLSNWGVALGTYDLITGAMAINALQLIKTESEPAKKTVRQNSKDLVRAQALFKGMQTSMLGAQVAFAEVPVGSQSARAMASYGVCIGVLASCQKIPLIQVTPSEVKLAAVNRKEATKQEMINWATAKHPEAAWLTATTKGVKRFTNDNEHLADAVAAAYAGVQTDEFKRAVAFWTAPLAA